MIYDLLNLKFVIYMLQKSFFSITTKLPPPTKNQAIPMKTISDSNRNVTPTQSTSKVNSQHDLLNSTKNQNEPTRKTKKENV